MNITILNIDLLKQHEKRIIEYINEVLNENNLNNSIEEIMRIYKNMCQFTQDGSAIILGALEDNTLMGFIWAYKIETNGSNRLHINQFIVDSRKRGKGIGHKLIESVYDIAKQKGIGCVELMATYANKKTMNFYNKQGFYIERVKMCKEII